ncbi:ATP-grasp domain-containing protein [Pandoraea terrae]
MKHITLVDGNRQVAAAMSSALAAGHRVTFFKSRTFRMYAEDERYRELASRLHRVVELESTTDPELVLLAMRQIHDETPIDGILGLLDYAIGPAAYAAEVLGIPFTSRAGIANARNKARCRACLDAAGAPSARYAHVFDEGSALAAADAIGYPVVLKPVSGASSLLAAIVSTPAEFSRAWQEAAEKFLSLPQSIQSVLSAGFLVEEKLLGPMVSVEIGVRDGERSVFMVSSRRRSRTIETEELGISMPASLSPDEWDACVSYASRVLDALGLDFGVFHLELIITAQGPRLVEVNPRLMGGSMPDLYANLTGVNIFETLLSFYLREPFSVPDPRAHGGIASMRIQNGDAIVTLNLDFPRTYPATVMANAILGRFQVRHMATGRADTLASEIAERFGTSLGIRLKH